jgi:hypothetical protein
MTDLKQGEFFVNLENLRIKVGNLSSEWFEKYPVWTWYKGSLFEAEDEVYPVDLSCQSISNFDFLFVKANLTNAQGYNFSGSVSYDVEHDEVYCVEIFLKGNSFIFNANLKDLALKEIERLRTVLGHESAEVFPLKYENNIEFESGKGLALSGIFTLSK